jgi:GT2 family glycosyltransferase
MAPVPRDNELGFWEPEDIVKIHDELLDTADSSWDDISSFPTPWFQSNAADEFRGRIVEILERDFSGSALFVLKDPRMCRLVPFWLATLEQFGAKPHFIITVRNPLEVAASLEARNQFSHSKSVLLWLRHLLDAERDTRHANRSIVSYEQLLRNWRDVATRVSAELDIAWPRRGDASLGIDEFLSERYHHHRSGTEELAARKDVIDWAKQVYDTLIEGQHARGRLAEVLDRIRSELETADVAYGPLIAQARLRLSEQGEAIHNAFLQLSAREQELTQARQELADLSARLEERNERLTERNEEFVKLSGQLKKRDRQLDEQNQAIVRLSNDVQERGVELAHKDANISSLSSAASEHERQLADKSEEINRLSRELSAANEQWIQKDQVLQSVLSSRSWRLTSSLRRLARRLRRPKTSETMAPPSIPHVQKVPPESKASPRAPTPLAATRDNDTSVKDAYRHQAQLQLDSFLGQPDTLQVPSSRKPDISIILVLHNQAALTFQCLQSIVDTVSCPAEVILIDNASTDETHRLLTRLDGARAIENDENAHFVRACNQAAKLARGEFILLLNNDTRLQPGALSAALSTMKSSDDIGIVGAKIVLLDGSLQEAGSVIWRDGSCRGYGRGDSPLAPAYNFRRDVDFCSGAFVLIRRQLHETLGGFDEAFAPAYYEEVDFSERARGIGFRTVYEPTAVVTHFEFGSSDDDREPIALQVKNRKVFLERHEDICAKRAEPATSNLLRARSVEPFRSRILMIENGVPHPGLGQGYPRSHRILSTLCELGHFVTLYPLVFPYEPWEEVYADIPREVEVMNGWGEGRLSEFLRDRVGFYETVLVCRPPNMAAYLKAAGRNGEVTGRTRLIYDAEAVFALRELRWLQLQGEALPEKRMSKAIAEEMDLANNAETVLTVCETERKAFHSHGVYNTAVLGHSLSARPTPRDFGSRRDILFVGAIPNEQCPNGESLIWFLEEVFPIVQEKLGRGVRLLIAGINDADRIRAMASDSVRILGFVDDTQRLYDSSRIFIAPTRFSAGIPLKIYEAAAYGLPTVASSLLASQLEWENERDLLTVAGIDARGFAAACARLYSDEQLWRRVRRNAAERIEQECSPRNFKKTLDGVLS